MENRGSKGLALAALIVGVVGLTIGFAAFTASLTINPSAEVGTSFDSTAFQAAFGYAKGEGVAADYDKVWTPAVSFTQTGTVPETAPVVTKTAVVKNNSAYTAYTKNTTGALTVTGCTPGTGATKALVDAACAQIKGTYSLPSMVSAGSTGTATVVITGPTAQVDGPFTVHFASVTLNYTTAVETQN